MEELVARINAVLGAPAGRFLESGLGDITIDLQTFQARQNGQELHLTHREYEILRYLAERHDRVVHRDQLLQEVWGIYGRRFLDAFRRLRNREAAQENRTGCRQSEIYPHRSWGWVLFELGSGLNDAGLRLDLSLPFETEGAVLIFRTVGPDEPGRRLGAAIAVTGGDMVMWRQ